MGSMAAFFIAGHSAGELVAGWCGIGGCKVYRAECETHYAPWQRNTRQTMVARGVVATAARISELGLEWLRRQARSPWRLGLLRRRLEQSVATLSPVRALDFLRASISSRLLSPLLRIEQSAREDAV